MGIRFSEEGDILADVDLVVVVDVLVFYLSIAVSRRPSKVSLKWSMSNIQKIYFQKKGSYLNLFLFNHHNLAIIEFPQINIQSKFFSIWLKLVIYH